MTVIRNNISALMTAMLFAAFIVIGYSFQETDSFALLFGSESSKPLLSLIIFLLLWILLFVLVVYFFRWLDWWEKSKSKQNGKDTALTRHPFGLSLAILLIAYIPYTVASYPAIFLADECSEILQWHPELGVYFPDYLEGHLRNPEVLLNTHMPIFHTVLLNTIFDIGFAVFHSANKAIFIYSFLQEIVTLVVLAAFISFGVKEWKLSTGFVLLSLCYFIFSPRIQNYMMVTTKDVLYADCMVMFLMFSWNLLFHEKNVVDTIGFSLSVLGLFLLRNDGRYILLFALLLSLTSGSRKWIPIALTTTVAVIAVTILFETVLLPAFSVTPGSRREMLSVPFQQTARYVRTYETEVTTEEKVAIAGVLDYDSLSKRYDPYRSDYVKDTFNEDATRADLIEYFKAWWNMLKKHPVTYVAAFVNNYYQYFSPGKTVMDARKYGYSQTRMDWLNQFTRPIGIVFSYPEELDNYRSQYETLREKTIYTPFTQAWTYAWLLMLALAYSISRKKHGAIILLAYPVGVLLICCLGPCNGFFCRYTYPLMMTLPAFFIGTLHMPRAEH